LETVPTISSLRHKVESIREQEMEKALSRLGKDFAEKHLEVYSCCCSTTILEERHPCRRLLDSSLPEADPHLDRLADAVNG
jgi:glutamyl-tRNA reductase